MGFGTIRQDDVNPAELGVNAATILAAAPVTSSAFDATGFNTMAVECFLDWTAATEIQMYIQVRTLTTDSWKTVLNDEGVGGGFLDSYPAIRRKPIPGADTSWVWNVPVNYKFVRMVLTSVGGTTDTITASVRLGVV